MPIIGDKGQVRLVPVYWADNTRNDKLQSASVSLSGVFGQSVHILIDLENLPLVYSEAIAFNSEGRLLLGIS